MAENNAASIAKRPIPRKLNQGMIDALSEYVRKGNYPTVACELCGIYYSTYYDWMNYAKKDIKNGTESIYTKLYSSIKNAEAQAEALMVETARNAAIEKRDGYLAITFNERRHPDRWGRRDRMSVDVSERRQINITRVTVVAPGAGGSPGGQVIEGEVVVKELGEGDKVVE